MIVADTDEYRIELDGPLVILRSISVWSTEVTERYLKTVQTLMPRLPKRWGYLTVVSGVPIFGPEGEAMMIESVKERRERGFTALAMVVPHELGEGISRWQMARIYDTAGVELRWFDNEADARAWSLPLLAKSASASQS